MAKKDAVVGLDIGPHAVKAAWAVRRGRKAVVTRTEHLRLPSDGTAGADVIVRWIEKIGVAKHACVVGLSGQQCMFQPFARSKDDPRTDEQAVAMEVVKFNEMASESMVHDFVPFEIGDEEKHMLLTMARPSVLDDVLALPHRLDIDVLDIVPAALAAFNTAEAGQRRHDDLHLLLDIGSTATEMAIGSTKGLVFARSFAGGGQGFTDAIAAERGITRAQAENAKMTDGTLVAGSPGADVLRPVAERWIAEAKSSFAVYESLFPGPEAKPTRVVLAGGASQLPGFAEFISSQLDLPAGVLDALPGHRKVEHPAQFAVAAGLAMSGVGATTTNLSLLPGGMRDELMFRHQKPYWIAAAVTAALILAVSLVGGYRDFQRKARHLGVQRASLRRMQQLASEIESVQAANRHVLSMGAPVSGLLCAAPVTRELITLLAEAKHDRDWLTLITDGESYTAGQEEKPAALPPDGRGRRGRRTPAIVKETVEKPPPPPACLQRMIVEGYTPEANFSTVRELIDRLAAADFVESADLLRDDQTVEPTNPAAAARNPNARRFVIEILMSHEARL